MPPPPPLARFCDRSVSSSVAELDTFRFILACVALNALSSLSALA